MSTSYELWARQRISELEAEVGRAHELNVAIREAIMRHADSGLVATMERLVRKTSIEAGGLNGKSYQGDGSVSLPSGISNERGDVIEDYTPPVTEADG
jgi:hypothetical protein